MDNLTNTISSNLVLLRRQKGLSLDQLAALSGVSKTDIEQIERGTANPAINTVWKIVTGLNMPLTNCSAKIRPRWN